MLLFECMPKTNTKDYKILRLQALSVNNTKIVSADYLHLFRLVYSPVKAVVTQQEHLFKVFVCHAVTVWGENKSSVAKETLDRST